MEFLDSVWLVGIFFVAYTSLIFTIFHWMLKAQITSVKDQITSVKDQITPVKELLSNHISDTNKKIDKLSDRVDKLSDRFDKLYDFLMQQQISKKPGQQQK